MPTITVKELATMPEAEREKFYKDLLKSWGMTEQAATDKEFAKDFEEDKNGDFR